MVYLAEYCAHVTTSEWRAGRESAWRARLRSIAIAAIARAYEVLGDENKRRTYDLSKQGGGASGDDDGNGEDWTPPPN
eukprot:1642220-Amphidinium_carterae.1